MPLKRTLIGTIALAGAVLAVAACGGGGDGAGTGSRETDPALVPTSTPIQNPVTFRLRNDEITIEQGGSGSGSGSGTSEPVVHTINEGDTCADIADTYAITVDDLKRANRTINSDCTNLVAGDNLRIPSASPTPRAGGPGTPVPGGGTYEVQDGDTCADIAANLGVDVDELIALNGLDADCTSLDIGDVLQLP